MNRTLSCTVNEEALAKAFAFLTRHNYGSTSLAGIARLCVETVAMQLAEEMTEEEIDSFNQIAYGVGRVSNKRPQMKSMIMQMGQAQIKASARNQRVELCEEDRLWWQRLGCCSEDEGHRYTTFLRENGLTAQQCSYTDWHMHLLKVKDVLAVVRQTDEAMPAGCDPSLPIAASDTPEELSVKALERQQRENEEKLAMEAFTRSLTNGQENA